MRKIPFIVNLEKKQILWLKKKAKELKIKVAELIRTIIEKEMA